MRLSIKSDEMERLLHAVAGRRCAGLTEAVRQVLAEEAERHRAAR